MDAFRTALKYCKDGLLRMTQDEHGHRLFCYTQSCFYGKDTWDDVTKSHRGQLYYQNIPVNKPFKKIFNVNEVPETDHDLIVRRMKTEPYEVLDKSNGHLFIVSLFTDKQGEQHVVFSTKGSLPNPENDLLNDDIKIFVTLYGEKMDLLANHLNDCTMMFEAIVAHDKHSMYDQQVEQYGFKNCFVLLGAAMNIGKDYTDKEILKTVHHSEHNPTTLHDDPWVEIDWDKLNELAQFIGCPVIEKYDEMSGTPEMWKEHKNREGYVIHFLKNNDRVKIKTTEYWQNRFKKDLTPEKILELFASGGPSKMQDKLPEEIANKAIELIEHDYDKWYNLNIIGFKVDNYLQDRNFEPLTDKERKWLFTESDFTPEQRRFIISMTDNKEHNNKGMRSLYLENYNGELNEDLEEIVVNALS